MHLPAHMVEGVGGYCADGCGDAIPAADAVAAAADPSDSDPKDCSQIDLSPPVATSVDTRAAAAAAGTPESSAPPPPGARHDVSVLLGGCVDARHLIATVIDAGSSKRCPRPDKLALHIVLNDILPEAAARAYVLLAFSNLAAAALPPAAAPSDASDPSNTSANVAPEADAPSATRAAGAAAAMPAGMDSLPDEASTALSTMWHVYQSPQLCTAAFNDLRDVLNSAAAAEQLPLELVSCTHSTWATLRGVFAGWAEHGVSAVQEAANYAEWREAMGGFADLVAEVRCFVESPLRCLLLRRGRPCVGAAPHARCYVLRVLFRQHAQRLHAPRNRRPCAKRSRITRQCDVVQCVPCRMRRSTCPQTRCWCSSCGARAHVPGVCIGCCGRAVSCWG